MIEEESFDEDAHGFFMVKIEALKRGLQLLVRVSRKSVAIEVIHLERSG